MAWSHGIVSLTDASRKWPQESRGAFGLRDIVRRIRALIRRLPETTMSEEKKETWLNYLALTTVVLAVCATLSTFKGGSYSTRSVLSQTQAANQWAYYQSKSIKGYLYEIRLRELEIEIKDNVRAWPPATMADYKALAAEYAAQVRRYEGEKALIQAEARKLEAQAAVDRGDVGGSRGCRVLHRRLPARGRMTPVRRAAEARA
jgi:hypothetical protein